MKYKVGDRVRIVGNRYAHHFDIGEVVTIVSVNQEDKDYLAENSSKEDWYVVETEIEPADVFTIGEEYTDKNGMKWKCIHIREDGNAVLDNGTDVIVNYADGSNMDGWDHLDFSFTKSATCGGTYCMPVTGECHKYRIHFDIVNGKPDWQNAKVTGV